MRPTIWRILRHLEGASLEEVSRRSDLDPAVISKIETGRIPASDERALRLVRAYESAGSAPTQEFARVSESVPTSPNSPKDPPNT